MENIDAAYERFREEVLGGSQASGAGESVDLSEDFEKWAEQAAAEVGEDRSLSDMEGLNAELLRQADERAFGPDDPRTDDELMSAFEEGNESWQASVKAAGARGFG